MGRGQYVRTPEIRAKNSKSNKGRRAWNKGIPCREITKRKLEKVHKEKHYSRSTQFKKGHVPWHAGKKVTEHPSWKGFRITNNRSIHFKKALLEEVGRCEKCGIKDERVLVLHHKDQNKKNNTRDNLQLLCGNCHLIAHHNNRR